MVDTFNVSLQILFQFDKCDYNVIFKIFVCFTWYFKKDFTNLKIFLSIFKEAIFIWETTVKIHLFSIICGSLLSHILLQSEH